LALMAMQPQHELGVLTDGGRVIPTGLDADVAPEEPEGTRDDHQHADLRPADAATEEGPQVLDDLQVREQVPRRSHLDQTPVVEGRSDADRSICWPLIATETSLTAASFAKGLIPSRPLLVGRGVPEGRYCAGDVGGERGDRAAGLRRLRRG
jgi:hypothetical protein